MPEPTGAAPKQVVHWMGGAKAPREYHECILRALRRMVIVLNAGRVDPIQMAWLKASDETIEKRFAKHGLDRLAIFSVVQQVTGSNVDPMTAIDQAENGFYGKFVFAHPRSVGPGLRVSLELPPAFLDWSYAQLFWPRGSDEDLQRDRFSDSSAFMQDCATNYLLKNFWHNYVHNALQGVNERNYRTFNGDLKTENDFEADNLATLLLVRSYGLPLATGGRPLNAKRDEIRGVLARNRCNYVFAERERIRAEHATAAAGNVGISGDEKRLEALELFLEHEYYFRRRIANQLSATLVEDGHCVVSLGVYATGRVTFGRDGPYRKGNIVIQLNGVSIDTGVPVYVVDPLSKLPNASKRRETQRLRVDRIVAAAAGRFGADMKERAELRSYAAASLQALGARMGGVPL